MTDALVWGLDNAAGAKAAWGTRAIWKDGYVDVLADRTSVIGNDVDRKILQAKMANIGMKFSDINNILVDLGHDVSSKDIVTVYEDDEFIFTCSAQGSYGYLYMTAKLK